MKISQLIKGLATYIPGLYGIVLTNRRKIYSAEYCYSVWLRHLVMAQQNGLSTQLHTIAELGPGNSLGTGLAALLSGASEYYAFDIVEYADRKRNIEALDGLVDLFKRRAPIPDETEFPRIRPCLASYEFPHHILTEELLNKALKADRIELIRKTLLGPGDGNSSDIKISYYVPWHDLDVIKNESVDMIISQAVLEHVDDLTRTYQVLHHWLKPGGFMSHVIDFKSHGATREWNGYWSHSDTLWKLIRGRRTYMINRKPHSTHIDHIQRNNFKIACDITIKDNSGIKREQLAPGFKNLSDDDLTTRVAFIQAVKST